MFEKDVNFLHQDLIKQISNELKKGLIFIFCITELKIGKNRESLSILFK